MSTAEQEIFAREATGLGATVDLPRRPVGGAGTTTGSGRRPDLQPTGARPTPGWLRWAVLGVDALVLAAVIAIAAWGRATLPIFRSTEDIAASVRLAGLEVLIVWLVLIAAFGGYAHRHMGSGSEEISRLLRAGVSTAAAVGIGCYLARFPLSRGFFVLLFVVGIPMLVLSRLALRRVVSGMYARGRWTTRVLLVGSPDGVADVADVLGREAGAGYQVVGTATSQGASAPDAEGCYPVLGRVEDAVRLAQQHDAAAVIFAAGAFRRALDYRRAAWELADHGVEMIVVPALTDVASERIRVQPVAGLPFVFVDPPQQGDVDRWLKRTFDVVGALLGLALTAPVMLLAAWRVRRHDGGPVLYAQDRVGRSGETFACLKFRTMVPDAEARLDQLADLNEGAGVLFKIGADPRVTTPGRWLRRYSLDELPQLLNVLRGDMSLVGPRPPLPREVDRYHDDMRRRLTVRPGLTGLWQVSGRSTLSWEDTVRLDLYYVDNWSMVQDLVIVLRTVRAVVGGRGAS